MPNNIPIVIIETPFASNDTSHEELHVEYARACVRDSLLRGEAPFASHLLYTQPGVLDDDVPEQRELGIACGHLFLKRVADYVVAYTDMGISLGMKRGIEMAKDCRRPVEFRSLWRRVDPNTGEVQPGSVLP